MNHRNIEMVRMISIAALATFYSKMERQSFPLIRQEPQSSLERKIFTLHQRYHNGNCIDQAYIKPSVRVQFYRGARPEAKKEPAPQQQQTVHGYQAPRSHYRKVAEHR